MSLSIITKPKIEISPEVLKSLEELTCEESQVVVHCIYNTNRPTWMRIRVQPTTYLFDKSSPHRSELVHMENIVLAPNWQNVPVTGEAHFSLIFSGLPKSCRMFDLIEMNEPVPFKANSISRNDEDVYFIRLS